MKSHFTLHVNYFLVIKLGIGHGIQLFANPDMYVRMWEMSQVKKNPSNYSQAEANRICEMPQAAVWQWYALMNTTLSLC